ncbi:MAG: hypothetical protein ABSE68_00295 [Minisyncoccia bacterium]
MVITELKPLILNLSDEDVIEEEGEGVSFNPVLPLEDDVAGEEGSGGKPGHKVSGDGFDLDEEMIENPGEEDF